VLKEVNADGRRKLPANAPIDFVSQRLRPIVGDGNGIDRRAWGCALLVKLRDELKAGNLSVHYNNRGNPNTQKPVLNDRMELNKFIEFL